MTLADRPKSFVRLAGVSKRYGGVVALDNVDLSIDRGIVHAVLGENGAGKSTLIKVISGVVQRDCGTILVDGRAVSFATPKLANQAGIVCVFQELSLMPHLSVAENISLASPPRKWGGIDRRAQLAQAEQLLAHIGCEDLDPRLRVGDLSLSHRQMVEIAKALGKSPELLILDEATSALTHKDVELLFDLVRKLRERNIAILYVSHRMHEIELLADRLSVFRNGAHIATFEKGAHSESEIVEMMIGREIVSQFPPKPLAREAEPLLCVENLSWNNAGLDAISFCAGKGEIVGLGGLGGQGQTELLLALGGVLKGSKGEVRLNGKPGLPQSPRQAKNQACRIALIPEDRKTEGLMLEMSVADNILSTCLEQIGDGFLIRRDEAARMVSDAIQRLQIKVEHAGLPVSTLSGGNQQKVVIAKWLMTKPALILLNDPTRGIDVGTKQEIYQLLRALADNGAAIVMYSSDYDELIGCCDRVEVMYEGRIVASLAGDDLNEQRLLRSALNLPMDGCSDERSFSHAPTAH